jgi:hypothetical protein
MRPHTSRTVGAVNPNERTRHAQNKVQYTPDPGRQIAQPTLDRPGLFQDVIDQLERQVLR